MRKYYWYISIFLKKRGTVLLASIVAAIVIFSVALPFLIRFIEFKASSHIAVVGNYSMDKLPLSIQQQISNGLTSVQEDGKVTPDLAERWSVEDDGKTYRFLIKKNLRWQDGKSFNPSDTNYQFKDVQVITTSNEIVFKLPAPFSPFPVVVSQPVFRSVEEPYLVFFKRRKILGTGKYQVVEYKEISGRLSTLTIESPQDRINYRFYLTEDDAIDGFKRGEVDILQQLSQPQELANWSTVEVKENLDPQTYLAVFFNTEVFPSNELRQALNYALPKPIDETRAVGPISPLSWAFADVGKTYEYDQNRAIERLLSENAIPRQPLKFDLTTTPNFLSEAEQIKKAWEEFGQKVAEACQQNKDIKDKQLCENVKMQVNIRVNNYPETSDFQALLIGQESPKDPDQYTLWHSDQPTNFTRYQNTRIDSLLERGRQTDDHQKRTEIYHDFQQFFPEDAPVIFIRHLYKYDIKRK